MNFADIEKVNGEIKTLTIEKKDKKGNLTKKEYAMVPGRVTAFRKLFPEGFITTEILSHENGVVVMKATAGYYDGDRAVILGTGLAQEVKGLGIVNSTSYIENCETSAVGRALGFIGLGLDGGGICSAEELANAITAQNQMKEEEKAFAQPPIPEGGPVSKADKLPPDPVPNYIRNEITDIQNKLKIKGYAEARQKVLDCAAELVRSGALQQFDWKKITMAEAENIFKAIRDILIEGEAA